MSIRWNKNSRLLASIILIIGSVILATGPLQLLEEYLCVILPLPWVIIALRPANHKTQFLKAFLIVTYFIVFNLMVFNAANYRMVIGLGFFWFFIFTLGLESRNRESSSYKLNLLILMIMVPLLSFRAVYTGGDVYYFENHQSFSSLVMTSTSILAFLGILISHLDHQERDRLSKEKDQSINWFSTLVNLVSHNLRSPLATILGNAQIMDAKYPSVFKSEEIQRITRSVNTSNQIIDRLLKASFVTDQLSNHTLQESLKHAYPKLIIRGSMDELSYEQNVSIHLSLEVFLDNAFRYSPERVEITMKGTRVEIRDYGPGLTREQLNSFGRFKGNSLGTLHGIGIPFALRILESIGYGVRAENCNPGLLIVINQGLEFEDAEFKPIFSSVSKKQIS